MTVHNPDEDRHELHDLFVTLASEIAEGEGVSLDVLRRVATSKSNDSFFPENRRLIANIAQAIFENDPTHESIAWGILDAKCFYISRRGIGSPSDPPRISDIAAIFGCSDETIGRLCEKYLGRPLRNVGHTTQPDRITAEQRIASLRRRGIITPRDPAPEPVTFRPEYRGLVEKLLARPQRYRKTGNGRQKLR